MVLSSHGHYNTALCGGRLIWLLVKIYIPDSMSTSWAAGLAVASLLALSGCTPLKVKLGWKVYLECLSGWRSRHLPLP